MKWNLNDCWLICVVTKSCCNENVIWNSIKGLIKNSKSKFQLSVSWNLNLWQTFWNNQWIHNNIHFLRVTSNKHIESNQTWYYMYRMSQIEIFTKTTKRKLIRLQQIVEIYTKKTNAAKGFVISQMSACCWSSRNIYVWKESKQQNKKE